MAPVGYRPTEVRGLVWRDNVCDVPPAGKRTARASWMCTQLAAGGNSSSSMCTGLVAVNNSLGPRGAWRCAHVSSSFAELRDNSPDGLRECVRRSAAAPPRRAGKGKWKRFEWRGGHGTADSDGPTGQRPRREQKHKHKHKKQKEQKQKEQKQKMKKQKATKPKR